MEKKKILEKVRSQLASANNSEVIEALNTINEMALLEFLPDMAALYSKHSDDEIGGKLLIMFNDLKYKKAVPDICRIIQNETHPVTLKMLVSSVWQSGFDYSEHLEIFTPFLMSDDFGLSFEAFTVIENNVDFLEPKAMNRYKQHLSGFRSRMPENIQILVDGLLTRLKE